MYMRILYIYLIFVNLISFVLYGIDKWKAVKGKWRIPEVQLLLLALLGGSLGACAGMYLFRHKTQHLKFKYGVPATLALHLFFAAY